MLVIQPVLAATLGAASTKPGPEQALALLKEGNERFVLRKMDHPHLDASRLAQAATESQGDHAYATILSCSDSRVPVELIFDAGIMDLFVVRVAGNVCNTDEIGTIEYGLAHVKTPVLVILGHDQCGAVTAVTQALQGRAHAFERNIPPLVASIRPAVERALREHPEAQGDAVIPHAIHANIWQAIENLFLASPTARNMVRECQVHLAPAMYHVGSGKVKWLPQENVLALLAEAEKNPARAIEPMAG